MVLNSFRSALFLLLVFTFLACSSSKENKEPTELFEESINLENKVLSIPSGTLSAPLQLIVQDSLLVFLDQLTKDDESYLFMAINRNTGEEISTFGRIGRGPDEFLFPSFLSKIPSRSSNIGVYNAQLFTFNEISVDSVVKRGSQITLNSQKEINTSFSKVIKVNEDLFLGTGFFQDGRYALADTSEIITVSGNYPFMDELNLSNRVAGMGFQSRLKKHPTKPLIVSATSSSANFEIIKLNSQQLEVEKKVHSYPPALDDVSSGSKLSVSFSTENRWGYQDVSVTEDYIYLLYSGKTMDESYRHSNKILTFNWAGEPVVQYQLDREISHFSVSSKGKMLYGTSITEDGEIEVISYQLPQSL